MKKLSDLEFEEQATAYRNNGQVDAALGAYQELVTRFEKAKKTATRRPDAAHDRGDV